VDACQVSITAGSEQEAAQIAEALLNARLAACVQVSGPVESRFWWAGRQETATEWLCLAKSRTELVDRIVAAVRAVHSYDTPEVIAVPIVGGDPAYLAWLAAGTAS
jgi:periplasmic divalent cation tolerance protein